MLSLPCSDGIASPRNANAAKTLLLRQIILLLLHLMFIPIRDDKVVGRGNSYDGYTVRHNIVPKAPVAEILMFYNTAKVSF